MPPQSVRSVPPSPPAPTPAPGYRLAAAGIALAVLGSAFLVDAGVDAGFDAPKRLAVLVGAGLGGVGLAWSARPPFWSALAPAARVALAAGLVLALCLGLATATAAHPVGALGALRVLALYAVFLGLGASGLWETRLRPWLLGMVVAAVAGNALLSLLQWLGLPMLVNVAQLTGRYPTAALLGNEGYVALAAALLAAACAAVAMWAKTPRRRWLAAALGLLCVAAILANRQLTSALALGVALGALVALRLGWRRLIHAGAAVVALLVLCAAVPALRDATWARAASLQRYQQLTTYRVSAWVAAVQMLRERPLLGFGPGSFAAESQVQRFAAESRLRERLRIPPNSAGVVYAHNEYLQLAAEAGLPALLAAVLALGALLQAAMARAAAGCEESAAIFAVLVAAAFAALAWFPLQIPLTGVGLLLLFGRAFRLAGVTGDAA